MFRKSVHFECFKDTSKDGNCDKEEPCVSSSFESLLEGVGADGRYQWTLLALFLIPLSLFYSIAHFNVILLLSTPKHHCYVPGRSNTNFTSEEWDNLTIPWEIGKHEQMQLSQCKMNNVSQVTDTIDAQLVTTNCQYEWIYDNSIWKETPVTQFDWVCDKKHYVTMIYTANMAGNAVGTLILPIFSDRFGRKPIFYVALFLNLIFGNALIFVTTFKLFFVLKFFAATAFFTVYQLPYIIVIELCNTRLRTITTYSTWLMFIVSNFSLSFAGWYFKEWKIFLLVTQLPLAVFILYWRFLPESPRWLLSRGKLEDCEKVMTKIAVTNGKEFTEELRQLLVKTSEEEKKKVPPKKIFTSFTLTKHLLLISIVKTMGVICASSLNLNVHNLKGNIYINYLFLRSFEFPGDIFSTVASHFVGRRFNIMICMANAAFFVIVASFFVAEGWILVVMCGLTKLFLRAEIFTSFSQVGELFPTPLRSTAYGIAAIITMTGAILSPSLVALGDSNPRLPYYIIFIICIVAVFIGSFLPETMGNPLPQTLKEAKQIGKGQSYFSFSSKGNACKTKDVTIENMSHYKTTDPE